MHELKDQFFCEGFVKMKIEIRFSIFSLLLILIISAIVSNSQQKKKVLQNPKPIFKGGEDCQINYLLFY